jgi:hypothetical protein
MMPAMERLAFEDLREPGATLGAGVSAGFLAGVLIGGVGGRLASWGYDSRRTRPCTASRRTTASRSDA